TVTSTPACASVSAAASPLGPEPTTLAVTMCPPSLSDTYCNAVADGFLDPFGKFIDPVGGPGDNNIFVDFQLGVRVEVLEAVFPFNCHNRYLESIFDA